MSVFIPMIYVFYVYFTWLYNSLWIVVFPWRGRDDVLAVGWRRWRRWTRLTGIFAAFGLRWKICIFIYKLLSKFIFQIKAYLYRIWAVTVRPSRNLFFCPTIILVFTFKSFFFVYALYEFIDRGYFVINLPRNRQWCYKPSSRYGFVNI